MSSGLDKVAADRCPPHPRAHLCPPTEQDAAPSMSTLASKCCSPSERATAESALGQTASLNFRSNSISVVARSEPPTFPPVSIRHTCQLLTLHLLATPAKLRYPIVESTEKRYLCSLRCHAVVLSSSEDAELRTDDADPPSTCTVDSSPHSNEGAEP